MKKTARTHILPISLAMGMAAFGVAALILVPAVFP